MSRLFHRLSLRYISGKDRRHGWEITASDSELHTSFIALYFCKVSDKFQLCVLLRISTALLLNENHVNISTDKKCSLAIRQALHLAPMQSYWQVRLYWTHSNVSTVCSVVWLSGFFFDVLLGSTEKATPLPVGLLHKTSWNPENTKSFSPSFHLSLLLSLSPSPSFPIYIFFLPQPP